MLIAGPVIGMGNIGAGAAVFSPGNSIHVYFSEKIPEDARPAITKTIQESGLNGSSVNVDFVNGDVPSLGTRDNSAHKRWNLYLSYASVALEGAISRGELQDDPRFLTASRVILGLVTQVLPYGKRDAIVGRMGASPELSPLIEMPVYVSAPDEGVASELQDIYREILSLLQDPWKAARMFSEREWAVQELYREDHFENYFRKLLIANPQASIVLLGMKSGVLAQKILVWASESGATPRLHSVGSMRLDHLSENVTFIETTADVWPFDERSVDAVISLYGIRPLSWSPLLKEISRILAPQGEAHLLVHSRESEGEKVARHFLDTHYLRESVANQRIVLTLLGQEKRVKDVASSVWNWPLFHWRGSWDPFLRDFVHEADADGHRFMRGEKLNAWQHAAVSWAALRALQYDVLPQLMAHAETFLPSYVPQHEADALSVGLALKEAGVHQGSDGKMYGWLLRYRKIPLPSNPASLSAA